MTSPHPPQVKTQNIGDAELTYLLYDGHGPTLVMLHATGFLPWLWHPVARALSQTCRVIAPYFCDHRESDPEKGGLDWLVLARDFAVFCKGLNIEAPYLVGHSMGATVLAIAAAQYELAPAGMILIEPIFLPQDFYRVRIRVQDHPLAAKAVKRRNHWRDEPDALAYLQSKPLFGKWDAEMLSLYVRYGMKRSEGRGLELSCSPKKEAALFMGGVRYDPWPLLPQVSCPVLVIEGEHSENRAFIDLQKAVSLFPNAAHRLVRDAGHLIPMEKPEEIADMIRDFFQLVPDVKR
ncbi:MAG: alpha/beta hydrolase [Syntrophus sp. (in: bacteria)]|nr:alpha/beta hydrolase [Syntrophus sp. (in: bacteria)]